MHVKQTLEEIREKCGGVLTEEAVVKAARPKDHPLHNRFTWDNTEAAKLWRLEQARALIRSVYVTIEPRKDSPILVRAYASLPTDRKGEGGYRAIQDVLSNKQQRRELFTTALAELEALRKRYSNLKELTPVFEALDRVQARRAIKTTSKAASSRAARVAA